MKKTLIKNFQIDIGCTLALVVENFSRSEVANILEERGFARTKDQLLSIARSGISFGSRSSKLFLSWIDENNERCYGEFVGFVRDTNKLFVPCWKEGGEGVYIIDEYSLVNIYVCYHYRNGQ